MKEFMPLFASITTAVATLGAVYLTQIWNRKTQKDLLEQQMIRDERKEKRNEQKEILEIYNRVLKADGEYILHIDLGGPLLKFNTKAYTVNIRPVIYEKYHLLDPEIRSIVTEMDECIKLCTHYDEFNDKDHLLLNNNYDRLIKKMRAQIVSF
ncbi:TPA: hypothetical protein QC072_002383 [Bacillus cereus]|nr:hypothetical protein [Bacillus cereus]